MNADMSTAPEIALLAGGTPWVPAPSPPTIGTLARELRQIADHPQRWWGLVRCSEDRSVSMGIELPVKRIAFAAWVTVLAPDDLGVYCDCDLMTVVAGAAAEESVADGGGVTTELRPGRMRVHGQGFVHQIRAAGQGYAISLHVRGSAERLIGESSQRATRAPVVTGHTGIAAITGTVRQ
jgi:hypothetical protein